MARTLLAAALPALAVSVSWLRLEQPRMVGEVAVVALLAIAPALISHVRLRIVAMVAAAIAVVWRALDVQAWELLPGRDERVLAPAATAVERGLGDFYGVVLPFNPNGRPEMHMLILLAVFGFVAAIAALIAARRPVPAAAVTIAAVGWPATLVGTDAVAIGAFALAAALSVFLALRVQSAGALLAGAAGATLVIAGAAWTASATTIARESVVDWERWDFRGKPARALGVRFVWDASYDGISFPPERTTVLRIAGTNRAQYWRASTLDVFFADRWVEEFSSVVSREASGELASDALTPARARKRDDWLEQRVEVKALVDDRLVAAGTPMAVDAPTLGTVFSFSGGVLRAQRRLDGGSRYRVWSYVPDPSPGALAAVPRQYPAAARRFLTLWGRALPTFGSPGRDDQVEEFLDDPSYSDFGAYRPLYELARSVTAGARSPYSAVLALESWFRREGGFRYEEQPLLSDEPPLVHFVASSRAGYCQHFAGAMAVMARTLGIPSRVAVGFTSGRLDDGAWTVSDHNAHAWVEVWFPRYGWIPFDPTPGRGTFASLYSYATNSPATANALRRGDFTALSNRQGGELTEGGLEVVPRQERRERPSIVLVGLALAAAFAGAIGATKWTVRRWRYLTRDPRRIAAASRRELEGFLRDQRIAVPASATLDDLRRAVREELGLDGGPFIEAAARGRFGSPGEASLAARRARTELRALLRRARSGLSFWARLRGFVSLRSLRGWQG